MNINPGQVSQILNSIPFPIEKDDLVRQAQQLGANSQIVNLLERLPNKTFKSSQELQSELGGMGKQGGFKL